MDKETKEEITEYDFTSLTDRRRYFQDHPEIFPELVQKHLLLRPPYKAGVSWFAYNLAKDVETRHDAHWQLQTFLLMDISEKLSKLVELMGEDKKERKKIKL
ncbi:MAG: hypothetical protein ABID54_00215 [Pseudomonadota bacterium]